MHRAKGDPENSGGRPLRRVTLTVDPDDYVMMETLARKSKVSTSWLVRRSMREFLERAAKDSIDPIARTQATDTEPAA